MPEDLRQVTVDTYNRSAAEFVDYFAGIGSRAEDINRAFELVDNLENPRVLEIGCGDGRDAAEIVKNTTSYLGFDISNEFIKLAKARVPVGRFIVADAVTYEYPPELDIVFAFASLLHLDKDEVRIVFDNVGKSLKPGGIFYISSKYRANYGEELQDDRFGRRLFYYYNSKLMRELAGSRYDVAQTRQSKHGHTEWFEIALRKV